MSTYRIGLLLLALISLGDLSAPLLTDGQFPPMFIAWIGFGLGLVSLLAAALAWTGRRWAAIVLVAVRLLSALTAVPAFLEPGVPAVPMLLAGIAIVVTLVGSVLVLAGFRRVGVAVAP